MTKSKVPPDHEWDESGKCKWCPATRYPDPPPDPRPGDYEDMGSTAPGKTVSPEYGKLCDAVQHALRHAHVPDMQTDDGSDYQFVDLMSDHDGTIATGERRIEIFAERIAEAILEQLDMPAVTKGEVP